MRVAIYARYSSSLQDRRSVDDQVGACRQRADREGWTVVEVFADYAISGAVRERPGLNAMLARADEFDIILSEAIDRISRHQGDSAYIFEEITFRGCKLVTLSEGEISPLHIGLKGTMAALFRADLADKIRRGQTGRVKAGRIPGGLCYGYRKIARLDAKGDPELGLREVDPDQAAIVRRIYAEFLAGSSPRAICGRLNAEGIPSPRGGIWRMSMINGDRKRQFGILQNPIYIGQVVYGRTTMLRDPKTRKRVPRMQGPDEVTVQEVPALRIVDQPSWDAVRARRESNVGTHFRQQRRPRRLLSGLVRCGMCGDPFTIESLNLWGCSRYKNARACDNNRKITTGELERRVLSGLRSRLLDPEYVRIFVREYHEEHARAAAEVATAKARLERRLEEVRVRVDRLVTAIANGAGAIEEVVDALAAAKTDRRALELELADIDALPVIVLHPGIADDYRRNVESLTAMVADDPAAQLDAFPAIRALIDVVTLTPSAERRGVEIEVSGRLANIIALATGAPMQLVAAGGGRPTVQAVAEARSRLNSRTAIDAVMRVRV